MTRSPRIRSLVRCIGIGVFFSVLASTAAIAAPVLEYHKIIVAGDPAGVPADSPANRVDANVPTSPFSGVGSLRIMSGGTFICTGTPIDPFGNGSRDWVLTAGHCLDLNDDGVIDPSPGNITFNLNYNGNLSSQIVANQLFLHPDFTGFNNPSINDDLGLIHLSSPLPAGVPTYSLYSTPLTAGDTLTAVGYGLSGDGVNGYTGSPSFTIKRVGSNNADDFDPDDEGSGVNEVFLFDFDGPTSATNAIGGLTLGNDLETTLGGGDSGGPSFIFDEGEWKLAGVNTFTTTLINRGLKRPPFFGSGGGGIIVSPYVDWIQTTTAIPEPGSLLLATLGGLGALFYGWRRRRCALVC